MRMRDLPAAVPRDKVQSTSMTLLFFLIVSYKSSNFYPVYLSVNLSVVFPTHVTFPLSPLEAPGGRLSPPLTLPPLRGRSLRSVSFSRCLFAQCRRRFWNSKILLVMEPRALSLSLAVCCGRISPRLVQQLQNHSACPVWLDRNLVLSHRCTM